jgi:tetratricopeptide (TPR) repeat protein
VTSTKTYSGKWPPRLAVLAIAAMMTGCASDPDAVKQTHLEQGDAFMTAKKYPEAVIEYRLAVQAAPQAGDAHEKLAEAFAAAGEPTKAVASMIRAADLLPDNHQVQLKAGTALLLARQYEEAAVRARAAVALQPSDPTGLLILANAQAGQRNFQEALAANQRAIQLAPTRVDLLINIGALQYAHGDTAAAERSYRQAAALDPRSIPAAIGLADFLALSERSEEAEAQYRVALALDPNSIEANRAVAIFFIDSGRLPDAEPYLLKVAQTARTADSLYDLAELNIAAGRRAEAVEVLNLLRSRPGQYPRATVKLASLAHTDGYPTQALELLQTVLEKNAKDPSALALKALIVLQRGDRAEALAIAEDAVLADARSEPAQYAHAMASLARGESETAKRALGEVLKLNPTSMDALLELAEIHRRARQYETALQYVQQASKAKPRSVRVLLAMARVLGETPEKAEEAQRIIARVTRDFPNSSEVHLQNGYIALARRDAATASRAFARAFELNPDSVDALVELVKIDIESGQIQTARRRVDAALAKRPESPRLLLIAGKAYMSLDTDVAEKHLRRAIELDASNIDGYETLAILYMGQRRLEPALDQFVALTEQQPSSPYPPTMAGILSEILGKRLDAEEWYEKALRINPRAAAAANNLAWLWVKRDHNVDQAYQLAQVAQRELPQEPQIADTLGFIALKKGLTATALRHFQDCVDWAPSNPEFRYHLGLAYVQNGEFAKARAALQQALNINPKFSEAADARQVMSRLPY